MIANFAEFLWTSKTMLILGTIMIVLGIIPLALYMAAKKNLTSTVPAKAKALKLKKASDWMFWVWLGYFVVVIGAYGFAYFQ